MKRRNGNESIRKPARLGFVAVLASLWLLAAALPAVAHSASAPVANNCVMLYESNHGSAETTIPWDAPVNCKDVRVTIIFQHYSGWWGSETDRGEGTVQEHAPPGCTLRSSKHYIYYNDELDGYKYVGH